MQDRRGMSNVLKLADIMPGIDFDSLVYVGICPKSRTHAAAAHALLAATRKEQLKTEK